MNHSVSAIYQDCILQAQSHYENFPVASRFLPKHLRGPIAAIYCFARTADDIADEGDAPDDRRIAQLNELDTILRNLDSHCPNSGFWPALADTLARFDLDREQLHHLLRAFLQDVTQKRYQNFSDVARYCEYSANPVGHMMLQLTKNDSAENIQLSNAICTGLQLLNFAQDVKKDFDDRDRIYIPMSECARFDVTEADFTANHANTAMCQLIHHQVQRANQFLRAGTPLQRQLTGVFGFEIRLILQSALRLGRRMDHPIMGFKRPTIGPLDWPFILCNAAFRL